MNWPVPAWPQEGPTVRGFLDLAQYADPQLLWGIAGLALLGLILALWMAWEFHRRLRLFVAARLRTPALTSRALLYRELKLIAVILAAMAMCVALARPRGDAHPERAARQGVNILVALDGSRSMLTEDVAPNRFALAQTGIHSLLENLSGDRAALMLFAGQATLVAPLSFDTLSLEVIAKGLDAELAGRGGSSLSTVVERGSEYLSRKPSAAKVILLVTDGGETDGDVVLAAQDAYQKHGVRVFTIGVGTLAGGAIPHIERDAQRRRVRVGMVRDAEGKAVLSRLEDRVLANAAAVGGGKYVDLQETRGDLSTFYRESLKPLAAPMEEVPLQDLREWFQWPLACAFVLLILEWLWPLSLARAPPRLLAEGLLCVAVPMGLTVSPVRAAESGTQMRAETAQAQQLLATKQVDAAFERLQRVLLARPDDPLARYNYALGAYAVGKYAVAIDRFEKLAVPTDSNRAANPEISARSTVQLGNSLYRLGEAMQKNNPEGAIVQWEKALAAYEKVATDRMAEHNAAKVRRDLLSLLMKLARTRESAGDTAARVTPEQGIATWRAGLGYLDRALKVASESEQTQVATVARQRVSGKIFEAYFNAAEDKRRRAGYQKYGALEQAIDQMDAAVSDYREALTLRPDHKEAQAGERKAIESLDPWVVELADREHAEGEQARESSLENAIEFYQKAAGHYDQVLQRTPAQDAAQHGQKRNTHALHDAYVALGDRKQREVESGVPAVAERDAVLEQALAQYQLALNLEPQDAATRQKFQRLGMKLTTRFVARGQAELKQGQDLARPNPPEAIAWLERSIQSFGKALAFQAKSSAALTGKKTAEDLLRSLRSLDAENQRKVLAKNRKLTDAEELRDAGKVALKLLDYDSDKLASKKEQDYTAPENKPVKDW